MQYDVVVIGSGPGGYICAIRCAQLGFKTAIVEKYDSLGGTCLNVGCIPSKAMLDSTEHLYQAKNTFGEHGIQINDLQVDIKQMVKRKNQVVKDTCDGVQFLMKKNKIDVYHGIASFSDKNTINIKGKEEQQITTTKTVIATGSKPASLPGADFDKKRIISSTEALDLQEIPKHLIVIGAGFIGLEMGSVYARMGAKVSVVEYADAAIPAMDKALGKDIKKILEEEGMEFYLGHKVSAVSAKGKKVTLSAENKQGEAVSLEGDYCLVAVGRRPYTDGLGLESIGIETTEKGKIPVNEHLETQVEGVYAIGDVIEGVMLAHKAEEEGMFVAEKMAGEKPHINYLLIPGVVYTWPEVASVGYTEEQLKDQGKAYKSGSFPFKASGRARASMDTEGFIKVLADKETDEILGMHMLAPRAADMIMEGVTAMEYRASAEDIARMSHPHPTFTEAIREACLAATESRPLHV